MQIASTRARHTQHRALPAATAPATREEPVDKVDVRTSGPKVAGSIGAMTGALTGRVLVSLSGSVAGGVAASLLGMGPLGTVVGSALGLAGTSYLEQKTRVGRLTGGMVGAVLGTGLGKAADAVGFHSSELMADECKGFSLSSLPGKLLNTHYTSHPLLSGEVVKEGVSQARPGDLIMTNDDGNFMIEILQKLTGGAAHWTHNYMVDNDGTVMDILNDRPGPTRWPLEYAFTDNSHAQILRPRYESEESKERTLEAARSRFGKMSYDFKFDLGTDDAQYCQEYVYKALQEGSPEIQIEPRKALFIRDIVSAEEIQQSPQIDEIWSTGSNFWLNWLSHFN
jgi:permuted papain-like amidase YaeF/Yiix C92 family enzyme